MVRFSWSQNRSVSEEAISAEAAAEAEISSPLILPSRTPSLKGHIREEDEEDDDISLVCKDEIRRRRAQKNVVVILAVGLSASVIIGVVLYGLTSQLHVPTHIWMLCIQATENLLLVALPCALLLWRFAKPIDGGDDAIKIRVGEDWKERRAVLCLSAIEIGLGIYVLGELHFQHRISSRGMIDLMEFKKALTIKAACGITSAVVFFFQGIAVCVFSKNLTSNALRQCTACILAGAFLSLITAVTTYDRLGKWTSRANRLQRDNASDYATIGAGSCLLVHGTFGLIGALVRKRCDDDTHGSNGSPVRYPGGEAI
ncbi:hypothetical protein BESB_017550 [Besnoitia besnoiti]|uniref:Transmembrane protein n=1 Tax=Besnoitia besnoiti TaxID=94643 RepID=A0A2A9M9Z5_BESBE|nr:hypothetical protein BESB_017550 [Besnoitia besnoiti]PFH32437.1 hypothetical protein BESB_017550 [Besnoitia besnoiti]